MSVTETQTRPVRQQAERCERLAHQGTGYGMCNTRLDEHGECPRAHAHMEAGRD